VRSRRVTGIFGPARYRAGLFCCLLLLASTVLAQDTAASGEFGNGTDYLRVAFRDDLVTVTARNARLRDVLAEIARQSDLSVVSRSPLETRLTLEIEGLPLAEAVVRIMRGRSYMLHQAAATPNDTNGDTLWVFSDGSSDDTAYSLTATSLAIDILRSQLMSDDIRARQEAIRELRKLDVDEVVGPLSYALNDDDQKIRVKAVYALADVGGDDAAAVLAAGLADADAWVRAETAYALGSLGDPAVIPILKHALNDADSRVRETAISAFTEIGGPQSADALALALEDTNSSIRVQAVEAIRNVGGESAIRLLNKALQDSDDTVREAAREAFAGMSDDDPS
jgi:hypothetical protein